MAQGHKEKTHSFVAALYQGLYKVYENILMNSFLLTHSSTNYLSYIFPDDVSQDSKRVFVLGENLYSDFLYTRFAVCSGDLNKKKITKNSLKLPKDSDEVEAESLQMRNLSTNYTMHAIQGVYWLNRSSKENGQVSQNVCLPRNVHRTITLSLPFLIVLQVVRHTLKVTR